MSAAWLPVESSDAADDLPLERYLWFQDVDHSWNPEPEGDEATSLLSLGLYEFDVSDLKPEELEFLLVSLGAAGSFQSSDAQERLREVVAIA